MPKPERISASDFLLLAATALAGGIIFPAIAVSAARFAAPTHPALEAWLRQASSDLGLIAGAVIGWRALPRSSTRANADSPPLSVRCSLVIGVLTFLISVPLSLGAGFLWERFLFVAGVPVERQAQYDALISAQSPWRLAAWTAVIALAAPIAEELVFRAGLFRFLRTRLPRWAALALPSALFAALHVDFKSTKGLGALLPLFVLGVIWSLAYERTGTILVSIAAHCLTNLAAVVVFTLNR